MEDKTKSITDIYIEYVTKQIEKLKKFEDIIQDNSISFHEVNTALANYLPVLNALTTEYQRVKSSFTTLKRNFDCWYSERYISERNKNNISDIASSKWLSVKELECLVIVNYTDEYNSKKEKLEAMELRVSFIRRLIDGWKNYSFTLNTLSQNIREEYYAELNEGRTSQSIQAKATRRAVVKE